MFAFKCCCYVSDSISSNLNVSIFVVSPPKQKRDICIAFPASSLSSSSSSAAKTFLCLGHFLGNYKG